MREEDIKRMVALEIISGKLSVPLDRREPAIFGYAYRNPTVRRQTYIPEECVDRYELTTNEMLSYIVANKADLIENKVDTRELEWLRNQNGAISSRLSIMEESVRYGSEKAEILLFVLLVAAYVSVLSKAIG